jgi:protein gp37
VRFSDGLTVDSEAAAASTPGQFHGVWRVGKKASGRMLDGQVWDEMPQNDRPAVAS